MEIDLTQSLSQHPELLRMLALLALNPQIYGAVLTIAAMMGLVYGAIHKRVLLVPDINPFSIAGVVLIALSIVAEVPLALGLGAVALWVSIGAGALLGSCVSVMMTSKAAVPVPSRRARFRDRVPGLALLLTATGRTRIRDSGGLIGIYGLCLHQLGIGEGTLCIAVGAAGIVAGMGFGKSFARRLVRRAYRRWSSARTASVVGSPRHTS